METNRTNTIIKNTLLLYVRSIIVMVLAIYTSRVLLSTLGVNDFGLYNVVGGIVVMFSSIKGVLAAAVQRFINFEKGKGNEFRVNDIFTSSIWIHFILGLLFVLIIEPIGLWYIQNKLVLPDGSLPNAVFVFHFSIAATFVTILTIPYDSLIIANEKMSFYAWISVADAFLKLLIIFILPLLSFEYLRSYAVLIFIISFSLRFLSFLYCKRFPEAKLSLKVNKSIIKEIGAFAGWNFIGCTASSLIEEGSNLILNAFGGVIANAARGIAYQVKSAVAIISNNVVVASQPFITQQSAVVEKEKFFNYIHFQSRIVFFCVAITVLPIYIYCGEILNLWLADVPKYGVEFVQAVLIYVVIMSFQKSIDLAFKSYGNIAKYQIVDAFIILLTLPVAYLILIAGMPLHFVFYGFAIIRLLDYVGILILGKKQLGWDLVAYGKDVALPCLEATAIFVIIGFLFTRFLIASNILLLACWTTLVLAVSCLSLYLFVCNSDERTLVNRILKKQK